MIDALDWSTTPEGTARELLGQLVGITDERLLAPFDLAARLAPLVFYKHWRLVHLRARYREASSAPAMDDLYALWREGREPLLLDGTSTPVFTANVDESLQLDVSSSADYIRFFCFAVRGDDGPFILFEKALPLAPADADAAVQVAKPLTPTGLGDDGGQLFDAVVVYKGCPFKVVFSVQPDGRLTMVHDTPLTAAVPAALIPRIPELGLGSGIRAQLSLVRAGMAKTPTPSSGGKPTTSGKPALVEMVELLLERALRGQVRNRLIEYFNATLPSASVLEQFAALVLSASPVVIIETSIPFIEETISQIVCELATPGPQFQVCRAVVNGDDAPISFQLPDKGPALVLIPLQVYRSAAQVERLSFDIATRDLAAIISCELFAQLPDCLREIKDVNLRLPAMDAATFATLFQRIMGDPLPSEWQEGGTQWVKHLLHTDFEHPRRMQLPRDKALEYIRSQVTERLCAVDPGQGLSLSQLYGLGEARQFAEDLIADIHAASDGQLPWSQVDCGALLVGPPGTGKTTLAKAIAKDCGVRFITASAAGWQAEGGSLGPHIAAIRRTFSEARSYAPSILFIDEIDSLGNREEFAGTNNSIYQTEVVNAVLEQMQGIDPSTPVFVIGATNHEERVDPALRRSGRLDRIIRIPRPNSASLDKIYQYYIGGLPQTTALDPNLDTRALGGLSVGLTGADVERIVRGAARRARKANRALSQADVIAEITNKPRGTDASLRLTPEDIQRTATHEAGHALALFLGGKGSDIGFVTVVPRDDGTLGFVSELPDERVHLTRHDYEDKLDVFLAGRAAEALKYGEEHVSSGSSSDLQSATALVTRMVTKLGLGGGHRFLWSESASAADLVLAESILAQSYERVLKKLKEQESRLSILAQALADRQELPGNEVRAILSGC